MEISPQYNNLISEDSEAEDKIEKDIIEKTVQEDVAKELSVNDNFSLNNVLITFSIVGVTVGTTLGFSINELMTQFNVNILSPILDALIKDTRVYHLLEPTINGSKIYLNLFIYQLISFSIILAIFYLIVKYALKNLVRDTIKYNQSAAKTQQKQNVEVIKKLSDIKEQINLYSQETRAYRH